MIVARFVKKNGEKFNKRFASTEELEKYIKYAEKLGTRFIGIFA